MTKFKIDVVEVSRFIRPFKFVVTLVTDRDEHLVVQADIVGSPMALK